MSAQPGKSLAMDTGLCRGWGRTPLPALWPCTQLPLDWHPEGGRRLKGRAWQCLWLRGAGALLPSAGTSCLGCFVLALQRHGHTEQAPFPGSALLPWLPPKPADQIPWPSRQAGCLTAHLSQLAPFSRLLEFSWMKDAMEIWKSQSISSGFSVLLCPVII